MKNLKLFLMSIIAMFISVVGVHATTINNLPTDEFETTQDENGVWTIKLLNTTNENLEIKAGEKVILDLNGKMLSNDNTADVPTIIIEDGGELTITNTSETGYPAITRSNPIQNSIITQPVIRNSGVLILEDGNILATTLTPYGVQNFATGEFTMNGGSIGVTTEKTYGLWNEGGATINGGRVTTDVGADTMPIVNYGRGELDITGGTFRDLTGKNIPSIVSFGGTTTVTGGQFEYQNKDTGAATPQDVSEYIPDDYEIDRYGNVVEVKIYTVEVEKSEYGTLTAIQTEAKEGESVTIKVEPIEGYKVVKVYYDDVEIEEDAEGNYTFTMPGKNVTVKAEFEKIETQVDSGETNPGDEEQNVPEDQKQPNNPENNGETTDSEKDPEQNSENQAPSVDAPVDEKPEENPSTLDSIVSIVTLAITSLGTAGYSIKKFIRK